MAEAVAALSVPTGKSKIAQIFGYLLWSILVALAVGFILKYVLRYYLNYNPKAYDPYWPRRVGLLLHISGGTLALLTAPWQFFTGLRRKSMKSHPWTGRIFLIGVAIGVTGATYLALTTTFGWAWGFGIMGLATAWLTTTGMAWYAIRNGLVQIHKRWMIRAYVVTFAFVTFRVFNDYGPTSHLKPPNELAITLAWACWVIPLAVTELIFHLRDMHKVLPKRA